MIERNASFRPRGRRAPVSISAVAPTLVAIAIVLAAAAPRLAAGAGEEAGGGAREAREVARDLLRRAELRRGVCAAIGLPPAVVLALVEESEAIVHVRDPRRPVIAELAAGAKERGLGIERIVIERGGVDRMPHASRILDAVFARAGGPVALSTGFLDDVLRALRPEGIAVFIHPRAAGEPRPFLEWASSSGVGRVEFTTVGDDWWMQVARPPLAGADSWSHWEHGPDNNPVSKDTLIRAPYMTQFLAGPMYIGMPAITTAAGGRTFLAIGHIAHHEREWGTLQQLIARNGSNGTVLWKRKLPDGYLVHRSAFIATPETFYMIGGRGCLLLDPATGEERGQISIAGVDGVWKWMAMQDGVLYTLIGKPGPGTRITRGDRSFGGWSWGDLSPGYYGKRIPFGYGRTIAAYDLAGKKVLWTHREETRIDSRGMGLDAKKMYIYCPDRHLRSLSLEDGEVVWTNADREVLGLIEKPGHGLISTPGFRTECMNVVTPQALIIQGQTRMNVVAISTADGYLLWKKKKITNNPNAIYVDGKVILGVGERGSHIVVDPLSGEVEEDLGFRKRACTRLTASTDSFFCRGEGTLRYDRKAKRVLVDGAARPACNDGAIPANGLLYVGPWQCDCNLSLIGHLALCSAGDFPFDRKATEAANLRREERHDEVAPLEAVPGDWPTYRGDNSRSGSNDVAIARGGRPAWRHSPERPFTPTAPVAAGDLVLVAGDDGAVRAVGASDGALRWSFATPAPIKAAPTIWNGRVLAGSGDGHVYALEAASGRLLWRFRAAPVERLIMVYGRLASTWPVNSGILVEDGTAYLAAGIIDRDGTYVYALDAATGAIRWQNTSSGHLDDRLRKGVSAQGTMAIQGTRLLLAAGNQVSPAAFDLATGACDAKLRGNGEPRANGGRFAGVLPGGTAVVGGRILYSSPRNVATKGSFTAYGKQGATTLAFGGVAPVWNEKTTAMVNYKHGKIICCDTAALLEAISERPRRRSDRRRWDANVAAALVRGDRIRWSSNLGESNKFETVSLALSRDAVVAVVRFQQRFRSQPQWFVVALDAASGKPIYRRELGAEPLPGGILIDRRGRAIVATADGGLVCIGA